MEVCDLFYNVLVWWKFMCVECIEFVYIDDLLKLFVLVCSGVEF